MATVTELETAAPRLGPCVPVADSQAWKAQALSMIGGSLQAVETLLTETLVAPSKEFSEVLSYVGRMSGKRLRPMLTLLSAKACLDGQRDNERENEAIRLAAVVELVHTATLVHDDMLDQADQRRHQATIHTRWDSTTAILCGDWLFTKAYGLANRGDSTLPGRWISEAACGLCEGELLQNGAVQNWSLSEEDYFEILRRKTGRLCAVACRLGAWTVTSNPQVWDALDAFGSDLGIAFQLHDDWLDYWGNSEKTGKPDHSDLMASKPTLPLIYLMDQLTEKEQNEVVDILTWERESRIPAIHEHLERVSAELYIRRTAIQFSERAKTHLSALPSSPARDALATLADLSVARFA